MELLPSSPIAAPPVIRLYVSYSLLYWGDISAEHNQQQQSGFREILLDEAEDGK